MGRLVDEENEWDRGMSAGVGEGPADCVGMDGVGAALRRMKGHGAPGLSGLVTEMMQATGDAGAQLILDLCDGVVKEGGVPDDWKSSVVLPVCRGGGDPVECGSCRGIGLLEHAMRVVERIFEHRVRRRIGIDGMRFGFMGGEGATGPVFVARQMQGSFGVKGEGVCFGFVDLEKAFDRVPREVMGWAMRGLGVEEWLVSAVMSMCTGAKTVVGAVCGDGKGFEVGVGMHRGSGLSPLLFVIVMEAMSGEFGVALPWELLCAGDLAVIAEAEEELIGRLNEWKEGVESEGMGVGVSRARVVVGGERRMVWRRAAGWPCGVCSGGVGGNSLQCTGCQKWVHGKCSGVEGGMSKVARSFICRGCLGPVTGAFRTGVDIGAGAKLELVDKFCYLGDMLGVDGDADAAVEARIRIGWNGFGQLVPLLAGGGVSLVVGGGLCGGCVRGGMLHGSGTWPVGKEGVVALRRAEMGVVGWMCGVGLEDRLLGGELRERLGVDDMGLGLRRDRLRWCGHVLREDGGGWVRRCVERGVGGSGPGGGPRRTWREVVREDCQARGLGRGDAVDRCRWRGVIGGARWSGWV